MLIVFFNARMCHGDTLHTVRVAKLSGHSHPFPSGIIKRITCFSQFELFFEPKTGYIFSLLTYKTLTAIVYIIQSFSNHLFLMETLLLPINISL